MFLVTESVTKVAQIYCYILGYFKNITFQVKTAVDTFVARFWNFWQLLISTSGHTVHVTKARVLGGTKPAVN